MPKKPKTPRTLPPNATEWQRAIFNFLERHPAIAVNAWANVAQLSEGTIRNALKEGAVMTDKTYWKLDNAARQLTGEGLGLRKRPTSLLIGRVGAGDVVYVFEGDSMQGHSEIIDAPEGLADNEDLEALEIEGESMRPFKRGWRVFYRRTHDGVTSEELNELCVVKLRDGRRYLKEIRRGYTVGLFNLVSWNAEALEDVDIEWAAKVRSIVPR